MAGSSGGHPDGATQPADTADVRSQTSAVHRQAPRPALGGGSGHRQALWLSAGSQQTDEGRPQRGRAPSWPIDLLQAVAQRAVLVSRRGWRRWDRVVPGSSVLPRRAARTAGVLTSAPNSHPTAARPPPRPAGVPRGGGSLDWTPLADTRNQRHPSQRIPGRRHPWEPTAADHRTPEPRCGTDPPLRSACARGHGRLPTRTPGESEKRTTHLHFGTIIPLWLDGARSPARWPAG